MAQRRALSVSVPDQEPPVRHRCHEAWGTEQSRGGRSLRAAASGIVIRDARWTTDIGIDTVAEVNQRVGPHAGAKLKPGVK